MCEIGVIVQINSKDDQDQPNNIDFALNMPCGSGSFSSGSSRSSNLVPEVNAQSLKHLLENAIGGEKILKEYKETQELTDRTLRKLVNFCVSFMISRHPDKKLPPIFERIKYAEAVVELFPKLADLKSKFKYAAFYDPDTRSGFFSNRLRHIRRSMSPSPKKRKITKTSDIPVTETSEIIDHDQEIIIKDSINFLNHCSVNSTPLEDIKAKMLETYKYRIKNRGNILTEFPRLVDTFGLVDQEFEIMFPGKGRNLLDTFPCKLNKIFEVYEKTKINPTFDIQEDGPNCYDRTIRGFLVLVHLLPPTARGRGKAARDTVDTCINKLIMYKKVSFLPRFLL